MQQEDAIQYLIVLSSIVLFFLILMIMGLINYFRIKKHEYIRDKKKASLEFEKNLNLAKEEITNQNLKNISWELHDNVGQLLSVASIEINLLKQKDTTNTEELSEILSLISKSLLEIRNLSKTLNPESFHKIGLQKSLQIELERIKRLGLLHATLKFDSKVNLVKEHEIIIFRILQEFIANTIKHSDATIIEIMASIEKDCVTISASDDGIGFDYDENNFGNGLTHMEQRAKLIGANFEFISQKNVGTSITLILKDQNR